MDHSSDNPPTHPAPDPPSAAPARPPAGPPRRSALGRALPYLCWGWLGFMFLKYAIILPFSETGVDFPKHYYAAEEILNGRNPFIDDRGLNQHYNYPTFAALIYVFLGLFTGPQAETIWTVLNALYVAIACMLLAWVWRPDGSNGSPPDGATERSLVASRVLRHWPAAAAAACAAYAPIFLGLVSGNIEPLNLVLLVGFWVAMSRQRDGIAGVLLGCLSLIKMMPVLFVAPLIVAGRWRAVRTWAAVLAAYGLLLAVTGWWRWDRFLFTHTLPNVGYYWQGISSSLVRIIGVLFHPPLLESISAFNRTSHAIALAVCGLNGVVLIAVWPRFRRDWTEGMALMGIGVVLMTPLLEYHHFVWALPTYLTLIAGILNGKMGARYFFWEMSLWVLLFATGYFADIRPRFPIPHMFPSAFFALAIWISRMVYMLTHSAEPPAATGEPLPNRPGI